MSPDKLDLLSIEDDPGKWMPFMFDLDITVACKQTSEDSEELTYDATTVFTNGGDTYIIDTPYYKFFTLWEAHVMGQSASQSDASLDAEL